MKTRQAIQRVFLSFANSDRDLARDVIRRLKDGGFTSLVTDADIPAGPDWRHEIREHIESADFVVLLITPAFVRSAGPSTKSDWPTALISRSSPYSLASRRTSCPLPCKSCNPSPSTGWMR